jgi:hypothetical protein
MLARLLTFSNWICSSDCLIIWIKFSSAYFYTKLHTFLFVVLIIDILNRYVGNISLQVTDSLLHEVFQSIGPVEGCKLIRKEKVTCALSDKTSWAFLLCLDYVFLTIENIFLPAMMHILRQKGLCCQ